MSLHVLAYNLKRVVAILGPGRLMVTMGFWALRPQARPILEPSHRVCERLRRTLKDAANVQLHGSPCPSW